MTLLIRWLHMCIQMKFVRPVDSCKEKVSYGKALSSHCLRAHQQRNDLIFVAPGRKRMEFCTAHGSRTEKWQADRDPDRDFCPGSETLPHHPLRGRELGAQPPRGRRRGHYYPWTVHRKDSCSRTGSCDSGPHLSGSCAFWSPRHSRCDLSRVPLSLRSPLPERHCECFA